MRLEKITLLIMIPAFVISCNREKNNISHEAAHNLFEKSIPLLKAYTDSMKTARDSAHVESLARAFESKIHAVNFEFPPDTDLHLSQEENDSLIKLTDRLVESRRNRLKKFSSNLPDSVRNDSTPNHTLSQVEPPSHNQHN